MWKSLLCSADCVAGCRIVSIVWAQGPEQDAYPAQILVLVRDGSGGDSA